MLKVKMIVRRILVVCVLEFIPITVVDRIRSLYTSEKGNTFKKKLLYYILSVLSYKDISKSFEFFELGGQQPLRLAACHSVLVNHLYFFGEQGYEPLESLYWKRLCKLSNGILELGANVGYHTVQGALACPGTPYIAVEPHPRNVSILKKNLELNNITSVKIVEAAVVGKKVCDKMSLAVPINDFQGAPVGAYLTEGAEAIKRVSKETITVDVVEASELTDGIDLIKIDVEGYEYNILSSIRQYIVNNKPVIFVEVLNKADHLKQFLFELCQKNDYKLHCFSDSDLVTIDPEVILQINVQEEFTSRDVILATVPLQTRISKIR